MLNDVGLPTLVSYGSVEAALSTALSLLIRALQATLQRQLHRHLPGGELPGLSSEVRAQAPSGTIASERSSGMADVAWKRAFRIVFESPEDLNEKWNSWDVIEKSNQTKRRHLISHQSSLEISYQWAYKTFESFLQKSFHFKVE
ncbi:hypothetical protein PoB_001516600 [Plakobranchus ocellatus]|uniref:Uncharacterized protein n=1 Tax=Plakobranchus ocellatus TaxID=259542 RepID=A0AAV3Z267_9GAST|nr:hypothetical protein PoB_001516600 [Plakobranchus ocellatus]